MRFVAGHGSQVRLFLQEVRHAAHDSSIRRDDDGDDEAPLAKRPNFERKNFNSELHQELMCVLLFLCGNEKK